MIDFQTMKKEMLEEYRKEERLRGLNTLIVTLREDLKSDDTDILKIIEKRYGDFFTKDELEAMIKKAK